MSNLDERNPHFKRDPRNYIAPYTYSEYPKYVVLPDGSGVTVENEYEEAAARGDIDENGEERAPDAPALLLDGPHGAEPEAVAGTTAQGTVIRKARQPGQPGRPSNAERAARAAAEAAAGDQAA